MPLDHLPYDARRLLRVTQVRGKTVVRPVRDRPRADDDARPVGGEGVGDAPAETAGAAGDEDDPVAAQAGAPCRCAAMSRTALKPKAIAGVMHAPGPG